jgi:adenylate cyclase
MNGEPQQPPAGFASPSALSAQFREQVSRRRHDLNGFISHILGFSEMLLEQVRDEGRSALSPPLELIHRMATQMLERTNAVLDAARLEAGSGNPGILQVQLCEQVEQILAAEKELTRKAGKLADEVFKSDLARIAGAARNARELALTLHGLRPEPRPPEPGALAALLGGPTDTEIIRSARGEGSILVVDDSEENRELLVQRLTRLGYSVRAVESGQRALEVIAVQPVDLVLLDILMPGLDGFEVLRRLKADPARQHLPVIMLSAADEHDTAVRCIKLGADDFLPKPFNATLLMARIGSSLSKKRLRDQETKFLQRLQAEQATSERLLLNILPGPIAQRLRQGETVIADNFPEVTVLFADFVDFTRLSSGITPKALVSRLNEIFSAFDWLCERHGLEKIKMIGDGYMAVSGLPTPSTHHARAAAQLALAMQNEAARFSIGDNRPLRLRIGLNTGPVVAGVIGTRKFAYDLWGDTVNLASRMQSHAPPGGILTTVSTYQQLRNEFAFRPGRLIRVKGKGEVLTYRLLREDTPRSS